MSEDEVSETGTGGSTYENCGCSLVECLSRFGLDVSAAEREHRSAVLAELESLFTGWLKEICWRTHEKCPDLIGGKVFTFGSFSLGVDSPGADIDTLCLAPKCINRDDFFNLFAECLQNHPAATVLRVVRNAFVPVIKLKLRGVELDVVFASLKQTLVDDDVDLSDERCLVELEPLCMRSLNGYRVNEQILRLVPPEACDSFKIVLKAVKFWAKRKSIYSNAIGFLGGVSWTILVARVCQLHPTNNAELLLAHFFDVVSKWPWPKPVILESDERVSHGRSDKSLEIQPLWDPKANPSDRYHLMPIITPVQPKQNTAFNVTTSSKMVIERELKTACQLMDRSGLLATPALLERPLETAIGRAGSELLTCGGTQCIWEALFERSDFFLRYRHYIVLKAWAYRKHFNEFIGLVESRIRLLVQELEKSDNIETAAANPLPFHFDDDGAIPSAKWFLGLVLAPHNQRQVDLTTNIQDFVDQFKRQANSLDSYTESEMGVDVAPSKRRDLDQHLPPELVREIAEMRERRRSQRPLSSCEMNSTNSSNRRTQNLSVDRSSDSIVVNATVSSAPDSSKTPDFNEPTRGGQSLLSVVSSDETSTPVVGAGQSTSANSSTLRHIASAPHFNSMSNYMDSPATTTTTTTVSTVTTTAAMMTATTSGPPLPVGQLLAPLLPTYNGAAINVPTGSSSERPSTIPTVGAGSMLTSQAPVIAVAPTGPVLPPAVPTYQMMMRRLPLQPPHGPLQPPHGPLQPALIQYNNAASLPPRPYPPTRVGGNPVTAPGLPYPMRVPDSLSSPASVSGSPPPCSVSPSPSVPLPSAVPPLLPMAQQHAAAISEYDYDHDHCHEQSDYSVEDFEPCEPEPLAIGPSSPQQNCVQPTVSSSTLMFLSSAFAENERSNHSPPIDSAPNDSSESAVSALTCSMPCNGVTSAWALQSTRDSGLCNGRTVSEGASPRTTYYEAVDQLAAEQLHQGLVGDQQPQASFSDYPRPAIGHRNYVLGGIQRDLFTSIDSPDDPAATFLVKRSDVKPSQSLNHLHLETTKTGSEARQPTDESKRSNTMSAVLRTASLPRSRNFGAGGDGGDSSNSTPGGSGQSARIPFDRCSSPGNHLCQKQSAHILMVASSDRGSDVGPQRPGSAEPAESCSERCQSTSVATNVSGDVSASQTSSGNAVRPPPSSSVQQQRRNVGSAVSTYADVAKSSQSTAQFGSSSAGPGTSGYWRQQCSQSGKRGDRRSSADMPYNSGLCAGAGNGSTAGYGRRNVHNAHSSHHHHHHHHHHYNNSHSTGGASSLVNSRSSQSRHNWQSPPLDGPPLGSAAWSPSASSQRPPASVHHSRQRLESTDTPSLASVACQSRPSTAAPSASSSHSS